MISQKKTILLLSALLVPLASPAMSRWQDRLRDSMFGSRAPQAPAGLREQAKEARIAAQKANQKLETAKKDVYAAKAKLSKAEEEYDSAIDQDSEAGAEKLWQRTSVEHMQSIVNTVNSF